ncbi:MAG: hypothetical protein V1816_08095 [Pseudomonadota bacterium]
MPANCQKCGRPFRPGQLKYHLRIELISLFDGVIEEPDGDVDEELERLIQALSRQDSDAVAKDVAQDIALVICRDCRNRLVEEYEPRRAPVLH